MDCGSSQVDNVPIHPAWILGILNGQARRTGNMYEKQRMTDVFRVPFVVPAPKVPWDSLSEWIVCGDLIPQSPPLGFQLQKLTFFPIGNFETYLIFV